MQTAFVRMDCGQQYAAAMLRKAKPLDKKWSVGDFAMYQIRQNARAPGEEWSGPARVLGFERNVVWLQHGAVRVTSAVDLLRPASTAEMLALQVMSRRMVRTARPMLT